MNSGQLLSLAREAGFQKAGIDATDAGRPLLVCALSCHRGEPDDPSVPGDPQALVAPFARRDYYREAVMRLRDVRRRMAAVSGTDPGAAPARIFANSRLHEKPAAVAAGIGLYGRHGLVIAPGLGSEFVIAGIVLEDALDGAPQPVRQESFDEPCGSCAACVSACPVGAIREGGGLEPSRCLQWFASRPESLPAGYPEAWGARLYGCQACQDACPHNRSLSFETRTARGEIGPGVSIRRILAAGEEGMRVLFRGTALGMSWIRPDALVRNALLAAGHRGEHALLPDVERYLECGNRVLREAAAWAVSRLAAAASGEEGNHEEHGDDHVEDQGAHRGHAAQELEGPHAGQVLLEEDGQKPEDPHHGREEIPPAAQEPDPEEPADHRDDEIGQIPAHGCK